MGTWQQIGKKEREDMGRFFMEVREANNLTQWDLAEMLKYSSGQIISNWERGIAVIPLDALEKMGRILKLDMEKAIDLYLAYTAARIKYEMKKYVKKGAFLKKPARSKRR